MNGEIESVFLKQYPAIARNPNGRLSKAVAELLMSCPRRMTRKEVSQVFCLSPRSFSRLMQREGVSYREVANTVLIEKAKHYLLAGRLDISAVSSLLGYDHAENFSRAFKSWTGRSPSDYIRCERMTQSDAGQGG